MPTPVHPYSEYGTALRTLRSARGWLGLLLSCCIIAQFFGFALMFWTQQPYRTGKPEHSWIDEGRARLNKAYKTTATATAPGGTALVPEFATTTTGPATIVAAEEPFYPGSEESHGMKIRDQWNTTYAAAVPVTQILALISISSQVIIIFITLLVVLVAQAPGVAQITRSLIWSVLLLFTILPWQYFAHDFPIPGVIYGYQELLRLIRPHVMGEAVYKYQIFLVYLRFVVWPATGLLVQLIMSERFRAGIMIAIGHPLQSILQGRPKPLASMLHIIGSPEKPRP